MHLVFGPVPSRRLGNSLGVNNIPPKHCSYSCVYCQVGRTNRLLINRKIFHTPDDIAAAVESRLQALPKRTSLDYITLVPDGEPTLDIFLDETVQHLRMFGYPIAVLTNGSLLWRRDVRAALHTADWISVKIDTVVEETWHRINRPNGLLQFEEVLQGIREFSGKFPGVLTTETMLVRDLNDTVEELSGILTFLDELEPDRAYLAVPTRPPAESWVETPQAEILNQGYQMFSRKLNHVELLTGHGADPYASSGDIVRDLLSISAVHPLTESAVKTLLRNGNGDWEDVRRLLDTGHLRKVRYHNQNFYISSP